MNVRPDQLEAVLNKQLPAVILVSGDEPLQVMESVDLVRQYGKQNGYDERTVIDVDQYFEWQNFLDETASMSLFATRRIIDLRIPSGKPGRQGSQVLKKYLEQPAEETIVLITTGKLDAGSKKSAWFKAIDSAGLVIQCWPIGLKELSSWVRQRFSAKGMKVDTSVVDLVCQSVEGNLLAAAQEIDKLHLFFGDGEIKLAEVQKAISQNSRYNAFELVDNALNGDRQRVLKILSNLAGEGVEPVLIIWALSKEIRLLTSVADAQHSTDTLLMKAGVWNNRMPLFKNCLRRHTQRSLQALLKRCAWVDGVLKGFNQGNIWDELRILSVRLASTVR